MEFKEYQFKPVASEVDPKKKRNVDITIVGSEKNTPEENQKIFGEYIADIFIARVNRAKEKNKKLIFDMATGSSPKTVWPEVERMSKMGEADLSNVIVIGHEESWGDYEKGGKSDFDAYRKNEFFVRNHMEIKPLTSPESVSGENLDGNFIPMHLSQDATESASKYRDIIMALQEREDTEFFGLYGIGTDGHIGEMQAHNMGLGDSLRRNRVYVDAIENYSVERGAFKWKNEESDDFHPEDNIFWQRGATEDVGRAVWQGYKGIESVVSLGWKDMLKEDFMILSFNDMGKRLAFDLALEGSMTGDIIDDDGLLMGIEQDRGEGNKILSDLICMAKKLEDDGVIRNGAVVEIMEESDLSKINELFKLVYGGFENMKLKYDDRQYKEMWDLVNRYLGKRAPVSRLIRLRSLFGKETMIVATPEVVKGTKYEKLLK